jgi:DNA-binding protein HU-beta
MPARGRSQANFSACIKALSGLSWRSRGAGAGLNSAPLAASAQALRRHRQHGETIHKEILQVNRIELVEKIASTHNLSKAESARILETITGSVVSAVKKGDPVQLIGFGTFKQVARAARKGFNPQAGAAIRIAAQKVPKFVPGAAFKAAVDPKAARRKAEKAAARPVAKKAVAPRKVRG